VTRASGDVLAVFAVYRLLQNNNMTGRLPPELGALPRLQTLDLSNNRFSGRVPGTLGRLSALRYLCVSHFSFSLPEHAVHFHFRSGFILLMCCSSCSVLP
jgi:hypothetical protein